MNGKGGGGSKTPIIVPLVGSHHFGSHSIFQTTLIPLVTHYCITLPSQWKVKVKSKKFCFLHFMMQHSTRSAIKINSPRQTKLRYDLLRQSSEAYCISTLNLFRSNWFFVRIGFRSNFFCSNKFQINTSLFE